MTVEGAATLTDEQRANLATVADRLIPAAHGMPSAGTVVNEERLRFVLSARPDLVEPLRVALGAGPAEVGARLDMNHHIAAREGLVKCLLDTIGGRMTLADCSAGRDADDHIGEVLTTRPPKPEPA